jgi:hypothetical protein
LTPEQVDLIDQLIMMHIEKASCEAKFLQDSDNRLWRAAMECNSAISKLKRKLEGAA